MTPLPSERELIARIRAEAAGEAPDLLRGIGDDCAVFRQAGGELVSLATTDTLVEGIHFDCRWHPPQLLGRKAVAVNMSDIAAMGGIPRFVLLSLAAPARVAPAWIDALLAGLLTSVREYGAILIGGDTVKSGHELVLSVTVLGEAPGNQVCYRSGASPDDAVLVSGFLGQAAAGLALCQTGRQQENAAWQPLVAAHCDPQAQVALGRLLAESGKVHAMMDLSDGLATDLAHLCAESKVGAEVESAALPMTPELERAAAACGTRPLDWALAGGEDYQLVLTCAAADAETLLHLAQERLGITLTPVGRIVAGQGVALLDATSRREISYQGYDHFR
ncbi:MAG: thiamine-phosphate kinase [Thermodesulfobacteriota bacterium]